MGAASEALFIGTFDVVRLSVEVFEAVRTEDLISKTKEVRLELGLNEI